MENIIETVDYKGFAIQVFPDYDYDTGNTDCMGELHCNGRDLYIGSVRKDGKEVQKPFSLAYSILETLDILKDNHIFFGSYGSHSGQWLNAMRGEIDAKELETLAKAQYKEEYPTKEEREYYCYEQYIADREVQEVYECDGDRADVFLFVPRALWGNKKQTPQEVAASCWEYWDDCIRGNVYGYNIVDKDGDSIDDVEFIGGSCWGFVGDLYNYSAKKPEDRDGYMIKDAKGFIDTINTEEYYKTKYKKQIEQHADTIKKLASKIA